MGNKIHIELSNKEVVFVRTALDYWREHLEEIKSKRVDEVKELTIFFDDLLNK